MLLSIENECIYHWRINELKAIIDSIEDDIAAAIQKTQIKTSNNYINIILRMTGKAIVGAREIMALSAYGYPDGALSLARNLYEQFIILLFFEHHQDDTHFNNYLEDYDLDYDIQRINALKYESENCIDDDEQLKNLTNELNEVKKKAHHLTKRGTYWWANQGSFSDLVSSLTKLISEREWRVFIYQLHMAYKRACVSLHANCMGNMLRLGTDPEFAGIDTSPSSKGQALPLWLSTSVLIYIFAVAYEKLNLFLRITKYNSTSLQVFIIKRFMKNNYNKYYKTNLFDCANIALLYSTDERKYNA